MGRRNVGFYDASSGCDPTRAQRRALRRRSGGCTQAELAEKVGVDVKTLRQWERGETQPGTRHAQRYAEQLQLLPLPTAFETSARAQARLVRHPEFMSWREQRVAHEWAQEQVAQMLGVSVGTVSAWERGAASPEPEMFLRYMRVLDSLDRMSDVGHARGVR